MKNLLKFELHNLLRQKVIYVFTALMLILLMLENRTSDSRMLYYQSIGFGAEDMVIGTLSSCFFTTVLAILIAFIVCRDYEQNVMKNIYAKGYTHEGVYTAKYLFIIMFATALYIFTVFISYLQTMTIFGWQSLNILHILGVQFTAVLAYATFYYFFCCLIRKTGFAIAILVICTPLMDLLLDLIDIKTSFSFSFGDLWITQTTAFVQNGTITSQNLLQAFILSIAYIVICFIAGRLLTKHKA